MEEEETIKTEREKKTKPHFGRIFFSRRSFPKKRVDAGWIALIIMTVLAILFIIFFVILCIQWDSEPFLFGLLQPFIA
jgi:hypothetical protein